MTRQRPRTLTAGNPPPAPAPTSVQTGNCRPNAPRVLARRLGPSSSRTRYTATKPALRKTHPTPLRSTAQKVALRNPDDPGSPAHCASQDPPLHPDAQPRPGPPPPPMRNGTHRHAPAKTRAAGTPDKPRVRSASRT